MQKITAILFLLVVYTATAAQQLLPADAGSSVKFSIKNFGFATGGNFTGLKGNINFDPANVSACNFVVTVDAATVNTGNNARDSHLKKEEYFDVARYPLLGFSSVSVSRDAGSSGFIITGNLTIKGVSKKITFPFTVTAKGNGYLFSGAFTVNRRDFGVGGSSMVLADNLQVSLNVLAGKK